MDEDFEFDLEEAIANIGTAEVLSLFLPSLRKAVVIDTRSNDEEGPMVLILPMAASPQERMRSIRRRRPKFPRLRSLTLIPWPRYVDSLVSLGVWAGVIKRFRDSGHEGAAATCEAVIVELRRLEKEELASVVKGENYHSIWSSRG